MNYTVKLLIPTVLGLAAAGVNWVMLSSKAGTVNFIAVTRDVQVGERFQKSDFQTVELPLQFQSLSETAIPYSEIGLLAGQVAQRSLVHGDMLFYRDTTIRGLSIDRRGDEELYFVDISDVAVVPRLLQIGDYISFRVPPARIATKADPDWIGPFRIVSVGTSINNDGEVEKEVPSTVTVAYARGNDPVLDQEIDDLERFCDRQSLEEARLLSVRVKPAKT